MGGQLISYDMEPEMGFNRVKTFKNDFYRIKNDFWHVIKAKNLTSDIP